ncbi:hypothetical protein CAEBREN_14240 [Caenorhabditis brenneri]|uniref:Uncharacterized protein n=1 Tax=Caenorhabditis brenneri TaxID=135651 RepID=G0MZW8_CAEBE|nr:hypothetical protein CAEBREN_14240 [Caenorhabditis brenneri]
MGLMGRERGGKQEN